MGFEDREYFRDGDYTDRVAGWGVSSLPPVVKFLLIANIVVFLLQIFVTRPAPRPDTSKLLDLQEELQQLRAEEKKADESKEEKTARRKKRAELEQQIQEEAVRQMFGSRHREHISVLQEWGELETSKILHGQVWRLLTYSFLHDRSSPFHILMNMLMLWWFGVTLESMYGSREFLLFYLVAALVAALAVVGLDLYTGSNRPAIGASGAVMGVMMLYTCLYPRSTIYIFWILPLEMRWVMLLYVIYDLHPVLLALAGDRVVTGIAHAGHLGGLAFGFVYWRYGWRLEPLLERVGMPQGLRRRGRSRLQVYHPTPEPKRELASDAFQARVDEILRKITEVGEAGLTAEEQAVLIEASRRFRNRPSEE